MKDINELFDFLPHRYPFLLVDRVLEFTAGESIRGLKNVSINELSGVLAFETKDRRPADGYTYYLGGTDRTRFKRPVVPGDQLIMVSSILKDRRGLMKFDCQAFVGDDLACTSEVICMERRL